MKNPEFASIETFVQFCMDDEIDTFTLGDCQKINENIHQGIPEITKTLQEFGLTLILNRKQAESRGFTSNNHDRYSVKNGCINGCGIGNASRQMISHWQPT